MLDEESFAAITDMVADSHMILVGSLSALGIPFELHAEALRNLPPSDSAAVTVFRARILAAVEPALRPTLTIVK